MKKISFQLLLTLTSLALLVFMTVQMVHVDNKLLEIARPARLFSPKLIQSTFDYNPEWNVKITENHDSFFYVLSQQTLYWLGRGMQAVVFETQDGQYVVKFFQVGRVKDVQVDKGFWGNLFSRESKEKRQERLNHREEIFTSSKMCFEEIPDETGIVYVHLNRTHEKIKGVKLVDKYGQSHRIRGDDACFLVQKKAKLVIPTIASCMEKGNIELAKARINQIFDLLLSLARKGFIDGDEALIRNNNMGFSEDRAIYIDTGHIYKTNNLNVFERMKFEFQVRLDPLEKWLSVQYPELGDYYHKRRHELLMQLEEEQQEDVAKSA